MILAALGKVARSFVMQRMLFTRTVVSLGIRRLTGEVSNTVGHGDEKGKEWRWRWTYEFGVSRFLYSTKWVVGSACAGRDAWQSESRMSRMSESQIKR